MHNYIVYVKLSLYKIIFFFNIQINIVLQISKFNIFIHESEKYFYFVLLFMFILSLYLSFSFVLITNHFFVLCSFLSLVFHC